MEELRVCRAIYAPPTDRISDPAISDHCLSLHIANPGNVERDLERRLDGEKLISRPTYPGTFTFVPALRVPEWFWESEVEVLSLYLPSAMLEKVAIENCDRVPHSIELRERIGLCDPLLEQLLLTFATEVNQRQTNNSLYLESLKNLIALHLLQYHCSVEVRQSSVLAGLSKSKLQTVLEYIETHLDCDLELVELAKITQLSSHHFGKLFKQSVGVSPHQYVSQRRVERAKQLLAQQLPLVEVGRSLGFCDQSHFTNTFRRYTGLTPKQYRQQ